ncbi:MAG: NifX-associated nitrogen fixation protein [Magnetovibrionaceae bacterium]
MSTATALAPTEQVVEENDPLLETDFFVEILRQLNAIDSYGTWEGKPAAEIVDPYIMTKERKREVPIIGDPDELTLARVKAYYNAIAALIEKECGLMAVPMINLTHEGFGRAIITCGKLVVVDKTLRDVHRFGFKSLSKMKDEGDKLLSVATTLIGEHPSVAGL